MSPYEEEKKKNDDKHHGGKQVTEDSVTNDNHNFGSVSKEIDDILGDISNSHDVKTNESDKTDAENERQKDQVGFIDQDVLDKTTDQSPPTQESIDEQQKGTTKETIDKEQEDSSDKNTQTDPFFKNAKQDENLEEQKNTSIPAPEPKQETAQPNAFFHDETQKTNQESQTETPIPTQEKIQKTLPDNQDSTNTIASEPVQQDQKTKDQKKTLFDKQKSSADKDKAKLKIGLFGKKKTKTSTENDQDSSKQKKSIGLFSKKKNTDSKTEQQTPTSTTDYSNETTHSAKQQHENAFHQPLEKQDGNMDQDVLKLLAITDDLLGKLPEDVISEFASSQDFELYKKVMDRYNIGK